MRLRRRITNFCLKECGLRRLYDSRLKKFTQAVLDEIDLQHIRDTNPCRSFEEREEMYSYIHNQCSGKAVDYLEFGVFRGDSIRQWASLDRNPNSRFFGFDSFEGLPEDWRDRQRKGHFTVGGTVPRIDDPRVHFIKGWFDGTVPAFAREFSPQNRMLLHLDADLYSSTMLALAHLGPFLSSGSLLIFDEFYDRQHEFKALMDWHRTYRKNFRIIAEVGNYCKVCAELC